MTTTEERARYTTKVDRAFDLFQTVVNTDPDELKEARRRRDLFDRAFCDEPDVDDVFCSGSLARKTHKDPIHDVDTVVILKPGSRPGWGSEGPAAKAALDETARTVMRLLGADAGTVERAVVLAEPRNHAVRCSFGELRGHGFTVDVMPALRVEGGLLVPVARQDRWEVVDPEDLIARTAQRQAAWDQYVPLVRVLKYWKDERKKANPSLDVKSLLIEVLAYELLVEPQARPQALETFFAAAALRVLRQPPVTVPGARGGPVQTDADVRALHDELARAARHARAANLADVGGDPVRALDQWREVFGPSFPGPPPSPALLGPGTTGYGAAAAAAAAAVPRQDRTGGTGKRPFRDEPQG